jgi:DNA-binding NarL/FixJ family response regulator
MRVILVGPRDARRRLRAGLEAAGIEVAGEHDTLADVNATSGVDGILLAGSGNSQSGDAEWIDDPLTAREIEVLELMAQGLPNKSIAERLAISDQTVKFHTSSIRNKLGARNRTEAVRIALRRGLLTI